MTEDLGPSLYEGFRRASIRNPGRPALEIDGAGVGYAVADRLARSLAGAAAGGPDEGPLLGVLGNRSRAACLGVLASLASGRGYVPLNPKHPVPRLARIAALSGIGTIVAGTDGLDSIPGLLEASGRSLTVLLPDAEIAPDWARAAVRTGHRILTAVDIAGVQPMDPVTAVPQDRLAYLMFTSGSTGEPKGVAVTHANVRAYATAVVEMLGIRETDRVSQMSDLNFDWSVHDLFLAWEAGACLCAVPETERFAPASFIKRREITVWASVPSTIGLLMSLRLLKPGAFPTLRMSVFCGEPLPTTHARAWQAATPNGMVENFYGPTETTVAITRYRWPREGVEPEPASGIVPIGWTFPGQRHRVVDPDGREVPTGTAGELCFAGSQVARGYWQRPEETVTRFCRLPDAGASVWYRTGDLAREDFDGCLQYLGRLDEQVKIRGFRVELGEIDHVVREASGLTQVASVAWPVRHGSADGIVTFLAGAPEAGADLVLAQCRMKLPDYMVPRELRILESIPLTPNGKTDRRRLQQILDGGSDST